MRPHTASWFHRAPFPERYRRGAAGAALALAMAVAAGCGGSDETSAREAPSTPMPDTTAAPEARSSDSQASRIPPSPVSPPDSATPAGSREEALPAWSTDPRTADGDAEAGRMVGVRTGSHDGFDRFVMVFSDRVPGYTVRYPDGPLHECGSGEPIDAGAPEALHVDLEPASAHNQRGHSTLEEREISPGLPALRSGRLVCDFEGHVEWVVGLERRAPFRVFALDRPARLVLDVRH